MSDYVPIARPGILYDYTWDHTELDPKKTNTSIEVRLLEARATEPELRTQEQTLLLAQCAQVSEAYRGVVERKMFPKSARL